MKSFVFFLWLGAVLVSRGERVAAQYDWRSLTKNGGALAGEITPEGLLKIENTNESPRRVELLRIENPPVSSEVYALRGEIRYENVQGDGFLEMWNVFPPLKEGGLEGRFFTRTLDSSGELGKISGTSGLRAFMLPFNRTGSSGPPRFLEVNLVLAGPGSVFISSMKLVESPEGFGAMSKGAWWSDRAAGLIGGIGGSVLGCLGGLIGTLAARKKARTFVLGATQAMIALGGLLTAVGLVALSLRQPYAVWFPLLLGGIILLSAFRMLRMYRQAYQDEEMRKMVAIDAGQG
jgi:hypothetical protein